MKKIIAVFICVVLMLAGVGCDLFKGEGDTSDTLIVWEAGLEPNYKEVLALNENALRAKLTEKIVNTFESQNPGKTLRLVFNGWGESLNKSISLAMLSNIEVDVVPGEQYLKKMIDGDTYEELDSKYKDIIHPDLMGRGLKDDKVYAVPVFTGSFALLINKNVLKSAKIIDANEKPADKYTVANINPLAPATMEDLHVLCRDIKDYYLNLPTPVEGRGGFLLNDTLGDGSQWRALAFMRQAGGDFADANGNVVFNSPENVKAFEFMSKLNDTAPKLSNGLSHENDLFEFFFENKAAYMIDGTSAITNSLGTPAEGQIIAAEVPVFKDKNIKSNVSVGTVYYSVMKSSKKKELAAKFVEMMASEEMQKEFLKIDYRIPSVKKVLEDTSLHTEEYNFSIMDIFLKPFSNPAYTNTKPLYGFTNNASLIWDEWKTFQNGVFTMKTKSNAIEEYTKEIGGNMVSHIER